MLLQLVLVFFAIIALEGAVAQQIDSPVSIVQCSPARLTFSGGVPPYVIDVIPGGEAGAVALESISAATSPVTWLVDIASGTSITLRLRDSTGALAFSSPLSVQPSSDASCIGRNSASTITATDSDITSTPSAITSSDIDTSTSTTPIESTSEITTTTSEIITSSAPSSSLSPLLPPSTSVAAPSAESPVTRAATSESVSSLNSLSLSLLALGLALAVVGASA